MNDYPGLENYLKEDKSVPIIGGVSYNTPKKYIRGVLDDIYSHYYFRPKNFEFSKIYEYAGVKYFKKILLNTLGRLIKKNVPSGYYLGQNRSISSLQSFEKLTRINEGFHLIGYAFSLASCITDNTSIIGWAFLLINTYSYLLQRYNRARVVKTLKKALNEIE